MVAGMMVDTAGVSTPPVGVADAPRGDVDAESTSGDVAVVDMAAEGLGVVHARPHSVGHSSSTVLPLALSSPLPQCRSN